MKPDDFLDIARRVINVTQKYNEDVAIANMKIKNILDYDQRIDVLGKDLARLGLKLKVKWEPKQYSELYDSIISAEIVEACL